MLQKLTLTYYYILLMRADFADYVSALLHLLHRKPVAVVTVVVPSEPSVRRHFIDALYHKVKGNMPGL